MREDVAVSLARAAAAAAAAQEKANSCSFEDALKRFTESNKFLLGYIRSNVRKVRLFPLGSQNLFIQP